MLIPSLRAGFAALVLAAGFPLASCSPPASAPPAATESREDADFALRLALLEGHLMIGHELAVDGQTENALPHFGHPVRELYGDLSTVIAARGGEQFNGDLVALESLVVLKPNTPEFETAYDTAMAKTAAARALIPAETLNSDAFVLRLLADIADVAAQEYRNALVAGKIGSLVEYHDARGFVFYARALLASHLEQHPGADAALGQAVPIIEALSAIVAPLNAPDPPLGTDADFTAKAAELRALVGG